MSHSATRSNHITTYKHQQDRRTGFNARQLSPAHTPCYNGPVAGVEAIPEIGRAVRLHHLASDLRPTVQRRAQVHGRPRTGASPTLFRRLRNKTSSELRFMIWSVGGTREQSTNIAVFDISQATLAEHVTWVEYVENYKAQGKVTGLISRFRANGIITHRKARYIAIQKFLSCNDGYRRVSHVNTPNHQKYYKLNSAQRTCNSDNAVTISRTSG